MRTHAATPLWSLAPALFLYAGVFGGGLVFALIRALGVFPELGHEAVSLTFLRTALGHPDFLPSLGVTLRAALLSTALSSALGTALALGAAQTLPRPALLGGLLLIPLGLPHLVSANLVLLLFDQSGFLARVLHAVGLVAAPEAFPVLVNEAAGLGTLLGFLAQEIAFVALLVFPSALRARQAFGATAALLGASVTQRLWHVFVPACRPAISAAALLVLAYGLGAVEVPAALGTTFPKALAVWSLEEFASVDPAAKMLSFALGAVNLALSLGVIGAWALFSTFTRRGSPQ